VGRDGNAWKPENYDHKFRGSTTLQQAIEESVNIVTVKLQERIGINRTIQVARRLGVSSPLNLNLTLALGSSDMTLLELTSAYGVLANQGVWMSPSTIRHITDAHGKLLEEHVPEGKDALSPELAYLATHMLQGVVERGTGHAAKALGRPVAAKTGTTNDYSNAWFIGFTPRLATGVWVGYDRPRSLGRDETGSRVAVPIWVTYMSKILGDAPKEDFPIPERVVVLPVDLDPSNECTRAVPMAFVRGTEPVINCGPRRPQPPASVPSVPPITPGPVVPPASAGAPPVGTTLPPGDVPTPTAAPAPSPHAGLPPSRGALIAPDASRPPSTLPRTPWAPAQPTTAPPGLSGGRQPATGGPQSP
jgi:penicillin-binding protein 1A